jgi:hypothetical protein
VHHGDDAAEQNVEAFKNNEDASKKDKQTFVKGKEFFACGAEVTPFNRREHWEGDRYEGENEKYRPSFLKYFMSICGSEECCPS